MIENVTEVRRADPTNNPQKEQRSSLQCDDDKRGISYVRNNELVK